MFRILGSPLRLYHGLTRRDWLRVGGLGLTGLGMSDLFRLREASAASAGLPRGFGRAKACILLYLYGAPSQLETFDVKPDAPVEIRGELQSIASVIPGFSVGELLPETAQVVDRVTVIRSMTHPYPIHGIYYAVTGLPNPEGELGVLPRDPAHWPFIGSVVDYLDERAAPGSAPPVPRDIALPWPLSRMRSNQPFRAGPYGGFLGAAYDPVWTEFEGEGTKRFTQENRGVVQEFRDPYAGIKPDCRFALSDAGSLPVELTLDRLDRRRSLVEQLDHAARQFDAGGQLRGFDRFQGMAYSLLTSDRLANALDIRREPMKVRESYGMTLFGQASLIARRLVEAGARLVSVFWDEYGLADSAWDTHNQHYPRMKDELCPSFDRAFSGLIRDLESRGLLAETLVLCISEHGRTPKLLNVKGAGRDHWSRAYSVILAGGGIAAGRIVGKTDRIASDVVSTPISPKDILATAYYLLGIDPETLIYDRLHRPLPIAGTGVVRPELLS
jgi:hypothetical protein